MKPSKQLKRDLRAYLMDTLINHPRHGPVMEALNKEVWPDVARFLDEIVEYGSTSFGLDATTVNRARELQRQLLAS